MSLNYVIIQGEVLNSPEKKHTQDGTQVVTFNISVKKKSEHDTNYQDGDIKITALKKVADSCEHITSGTKVIIEGKLYTRSIENRSGNKQKIPYIQASNVEVLGLPNRITDFSPTQIIDHSENQEENIPF